MITLYDNPFSPFARKVRLVLAHKGIDFTRVDALALKHREDLLAVNPRGEVPVLADGDVTVIGSSDIVAYLDHRYPVPPVFPGDPRLRVAARSWERLADGIVDAIIHDISIWAWPTHRRQDTPPPGLIEAGSRDLSKILARLEGALDGKHFLCGEVSIADFAMFPHVSSLKPLGVELGATTYPKLYEWNRHMRALPAVRMDVESVKRAAVEKFVDGPSPYEGEKIVWRGDRIEWLMHNGFHEWWHEEVLAGRAVVPSSI